MFKLTLVTPEKKLVADQEIEEIILPGFYGELNLLPGHTPLMTTLGAGIVSFRPKGEVGFQRASVGWGYCQVNPTGVYVLAEAAMVASDVDGAVVKSRLKEEESRLGQEALSDLDWEKTHREIQRLQAELDLKDLR